MDYYKILDIDKNASKDTIKKAFRKLSLKYHPDKPTGDAEKFKKINEAYQTLSDDNKKRIYDMQKSGIPGMPGMPGMSGMHVNFPPGFQQFGNQEGVPDILKMFFGGIDPHQMPNTGGDPFNPFINIRTQISKPTPIQKTVVISLVSAFEGITYPVEIERTVAQND